MKESIIKILIISITPIIMFVMFVSTLKDAIFESNTIRFSDINDIFAKSNQKTIEFTKDMNKIKEFIMEELLSRNIFSKSLTIINKILAVIALIISIIFPMFLLKFRNIPYFICANLVILVFYMKSFSLKKSIHNANFKNEIITRGISVKNPVLITIIAMVMIGINSGIILFKYHTVFFIVFLLASCLNIFTISLSNAIALTKEGKKEREKLLELKKYMKDYSLIKKRDIESVIIWDMYLAYATAFGMPNKVTKTIFEKWYNLNLSLQIIAQI